MLDAHPMPDALARPPVPTVAIDQPCELNRSIAGDGMFAAAWALLPVLEKGWARAIPRHFGRRCETPSARQASKALGM